MPEKIPQDALEIMNIDWKDETNIGDLLLNNDDFISYISEMIDVRLQKLQEKSIKKTTERIHNTFPKFYKGNSLSTFLLPPSQRSSYSNFRFCYSPRIKPSN